MSGAGPTPSDHYSYSVYADPAMAEAFDTMRFSGPIGRLIAESQERVIASFLSPLAGRTVLDVGTGTGRAALALAVRGATVTGVDASAEMLAVCRAQEAAWNRGDLDGFMAQGYWNSPQLTFFSGGSDTRGYDAMLERYRVRYTQGGNAMGKLSFSALEAVPLAADAGLVRGRWKVEFPDGHAIEGLFTLAMQRFPAGWRIVHDHTSVAQ